MSSTLKLTCSLAAFIVGAAIGALAGTLAAAEIFALGFGISAASAEGTKHEFYLILMTFNGAIFGFVGGGVAGLMLIRSMLRAKSSTETPPR
ncbi:hypothetical protein [Microvirga terrestris]|uniref:Uncharacterized protein n=1 Tax=Microvirga terrestris TaxID=2791024 RepID=A0ABS0HV98_9HYPH|nr:hypothetical protein [Microvirga terrestris]MBF9197393.1 hypothetical protein [Microvirga terrestris]